MFSLSVIIGIVSFVLVFVFGTAGYFFKKLQNKYKTFQITMRIILLIIGVFGLIYFIFLRYLPDVCKLINNQHLNKEITSIFYSKVLLLDLCPFIYVILCLFLILDIKLKFINIVSLWAFIGGSVTIFGSIWTNDVTYNNLTRFIFVESKEGELYFWIHIFCLCNSIFLIFYTNKFKLLSFLLAHVFVSLYLIYVYIIVKCLGIIRNATGLVEFDWVNPNGEYHAVYLMFNQLKFIDILFVGYFLIWLFLVLLIIIKNIFSEPVEYNFWPNWVYKKFSFIKGISEALYKTKLNICNKLKIKKKIKKINTL